MKGVIYTDTKAGAGACGAFDTAHTGTGGTKSGYRAYDLETVSGRTRVPDGLSGSSYKTVGRSVRTGKTGTEPGAFLPAGACGRSENGGYGTDSGSEKPT